ncbi:uncharacterized protein BKCO1_6300028 [Diplodia corticola]|uniref:Uncharacterized protein n=1 Tax=Diplodia corticola TaxID=236234 RepID=A0A1J9QP88_9PEZI|nr:uncharacterized protein BKCO1_6300028 [Diplodia corticola]OJD30265.1 hypothetical protein BKCO1_6300028 [Diplodia corticola]
MSVNASFFLSSTEDKCVYNGASIDASDLTTNGNLCAYIPGVNRVWACSAPDRVCWSYDQTCKGGSTTTPDDTQIYCGSNGAEWCCSDQEECTRTPGQINVCWGLWRNPTYNMTDAEALLYNQEHYSVLASTTTAASASASAAASTAATTSAPATNAASASASASASSAASAAAAASSSSSSASSLSSGAVAGIAVGCVVGGVALAGIAGLIFWRRRRRGGSSDGGATSTPDAATEQKYREGDGEALSHELHSEAQVYEAEGSAVYARDGGQAKVGGAGTHELPGQRYA